MHRHRGDEEPRSYRAAWQRDLLWSSLALDADLSSAGGEHLPPLGMDVVLKVSLIFRCWRALSPSLGEGCTLYISPLNCYTFLPCSLDRGLRYQRAGEKLPSGTACAFQTDG